MTRAPRALLLALLLPALALLGGCGALAKNPLQGAFTNRLAVTLADDECLSASRWGPIAITGDVDARDCQVLVEALRLRALMQQMLRQAQQGGPAPSVHRGDDI